MAKSTPIALRLLRTLFSITNQIAPKLADKWAVHLFLKPVRAPYTDAGRELIAEATAKEIEVDGRVLKGYSIGEGPVVICMHGWAGKTTQFAHIAWALRDAGYTFLGFDAPAHGVNPGTSSNMFEFKALVTALVAQTENVACVVGHSLGASAISLAIHEGLVIPKLVVLGAPVVAEDILNTFCETIWGTERTKKAIRDGCLRLFDIEFDQLTMEHTFKSCTSIPALGIHGTEDIDADVSHLDILHKIHPSMQSYKAKGLGHRRILKDQAVIDRIIAFIES